MPISKIEPSALDVGQIGGRRNLIINGAMQVAQRGTSSTSTSNYQTVDRFELASSSDGAFTQSQDTDAPDGFSNSFKMVCTTADTDLGAAQEIYFQQPIEAQNLQHLCYGTSAAKTLTLSFWVKSNKTGTTGVWLYAPDSARDLAVPYTIDSADTWEYKTLQFVGDTSGVINNDNGKGLEVRFYLAGGSAIVGTQSGVWDATYTGRIPTGAINFGDAVNNYWQITGVQLEVGSVATPFEHRSYGEELALCQRYFYKYPNQNSWGMQTIDLGSTYARTQVFFPQTMRATPSMGNITYATTTGATGAQFLSTNSVTLFANPTLSGLNQFAGEWTADAEL